jgi:tetratricopeptide (TPR) repeat protein
MGEILTIVAIVVSAAIGIPALILQRKQTRLAEDAQKPFPIDRITESNRVSENDEISPTSPIGRFRPTRLFSGSNSGSSLLVGRENELACLEAAWGPAKKNLVCLVAWGGMGKTSLVARWAAAKLAEPDHSGMEWYFDWSFYSQGTRGVEESGVPRIAVSADYFINEALRFFGRDDLAETSVGAWKKGEELARLAGSSRGLLILDGIESLQDAKTGEVTDQAMRALIRGLATHNSGLCLVTTREHIPDLAIWRNATVSEWKLERLSDAAGAMLLTELGVSGTDVEKVQLSSQVKGHALTLTLVGRYLKRCHQGDIRRVDRVRFTRVNVSEQGGHAFRVIEAYQQWFMEHGCTTELTILRIVGLFDRPATPDCVAALRAPSIRGLTDQITSLSDDDWNAALNHLEELGLVARHPWEPPLIEGRSGPGGKLEPAHRRRVMSSDDKSIDAHPLVREYFARQLHDNAKRIWRDGNRRLFEHLSSSVPHWPEGLAGLQPLYQAIGHGCRGGKHKEACNKVYHDRILRAGFDGHYSALTLGAISSDLSAIACFFETPWHRLLKGFSQSDQAFVLNNAAVYLLWLGRLSEARDPFLKSMEICVHQKDWNAAALRASNLSELEVKLGNLDSGVRYGENAVDYAERGGSGMELVIDLATLGDALHQRGRTDEADSVYQRALTITPVLTSYRGMRYRDFQLGPMERIAWSLFLRVPNDQGQEEHDLTTLRARCQQLLTDANESLEVANRVSRRLEMDLERIVVARIALCLAVFAEGDNERQTTLSMAAEVIREAINGLRSHGRYDELPKALIARAWLEGLNGDRNAAGQSLHEAEQLSQRGPAPMKLQLADVYLHQARIVRDATALAKAASLINSINYARRFEELSVAQRAASALHGS